MAGILLVDPVVDPAFPVPAGARRSFVDGPLYDVATEAVLVPYAADPAWHRLSHAAGLSGEDVGLNRFEPTRFYLLGGLLADPPAGDVQAPSQLRANLPGSGHPTLLRILNLNYFPARIRFTDASGRPVVMAEAIAHDGQPFRDTSDRTGPSPPVRDTGHPLLTSVLAFGAAERYDVLLRPSSAGTFMVHVDWHHWVTGQILATRSIPLQVR
jgi:hypothetical protein